MEDIIRQEQRLLVRLFRRVRGEFRREYERDITSSQLHVLDLLSERGPTKMTDLAEEMLVTLGAVTLLADRLIKNGWIERQRSTTDRRVVMLNITEEGVALTQHFRLIRKGVLDKYFAKLTTEEIRVLGSILNKMNDTE